MTHILIVDDEDLIRTALRRTLLLEGFEVSEATNGEEALTLFRRESPDVVVTDLFMPEKEGIETILELKRDHPEAKIIAMTGGRKGYLQDALEVAKRMGASRTLAKPFEPEELLDAIQQLMAA
jgi:CheY-like chemotaxis protein